MTQNPIPSNARSAGAAAAGAPVNAMPSDTALFGDEMLAAVACPPTAPTPTRSEPAPRSLEAERPGVEVRRSARRRRTVSAYRDGARTIVLIPARMSKAEERRWIGVMLERLEAKERRRQGLARAGDAELHERALALSRRWLDGRAVPVSVQWSARQNTRWGSCTPADGSIRLSERLRPMPSWVVDYVLVHELAHLLHADHGPAFHSLVGRYPKADRARGFLEGVVAGANQAAATEC